FSNKAFGADDKTCSEGWSKGSPKSADINHCAMNVGTRHRHCNPFFILEIIVIIVLHDDKIVFLRQFYQVYTSLGAAWTRGGILVMGRHAQHADCTRLEYIAQHICVNSVLIHRNGL